MYNRDSSPEMLQRLSVATELMNGQDMDIRGSGLESPARLYEIKDLQRYHSQSSHTSIDIYSVQSMPAIKANAANSPTMAS